MVSRLDWAFPNGLTNAGLTLGSAATGPLVAWLMERAGWRQSFVLTAPLAFVFAAVWWWYARDAPADHPGVSQEELDLIDAERPPPTAAECEAGSWKAVLRNREVLLLAASYFCSNYLFYFFFNWLFIYLVQSRGFAMLEGGFYAAPPGSSVPSAPSWGATPAIGSRGASAHAGATPRRPSWACSSARG